ncbi:hypothetical protein FACS189415_7440 [Bacteroidia bacterium]|nr:hypothetical protein FACS189415_7440 [Bacteroidia bacterium]
MKKRLFALLAITFLLLTGCTTTPITESTASPEQKKVDFPSIIDSDYFITFEEGDYTYGFKDDGVYKIGKSNPVVQRLYTADDVYSLYEYEGQLYFNTDNKIYKMDLDGGNVATVLDAKEHTEKQNDMVIENFSLSQGYIVFSSALELFRYRLSDGNLMDLNEDAYIFELVGNNLYYIDHAERTWTIFCYDLNTNKRTIIRGENVYKPSHDVIRDFLFIGEDLYYYKREPNQICKYDPGGNDTVICDYSHLFNPISLDGEYQGKLYYWVYTEFIVGKNVASGGNKEYDEANHRVAEQGIKQYTLMQYDPETERTLAVCQVYSLREPSAFFANGHAFIETNRAISPTNEDVAWEWETRAIDLSTGEWREVQPAQ